MDTFITEEQKIILNVISERSRFIQHVYYCKSSVLIQCLLLTDSVHFKAPKYLYQYETKRVIHSNHNMQINPLRVIATRHLLTLFTWTCALQLFRLRCQKVSLTGSTRRRQRQGTSEGCATYIHTHILYIYICGTPPLWITHLTTCAAQECDVSFEFSDPLWVDAVWYSSCRGRSVREWLRVCLCTPRIESQRKKKKRKEKKRGGIGLCLFGIQGEQSDRLVRIDQHFALPLWI